MPRILIVDDNGDNICLLKDLLTGQGHEVVVAFNGAEALEQAAQKPPDLVIADILMPVMDGFTLCRLWKADGRFRAIPLVFYTATYTEPKDEQLALSLGADLFLVKPLEPDLFLRKIEEVMVKHALGVFRPTERPGPPEPVFLKEYNEVLIRKLEDKLAEVEQNHCLLREKEAFVRAVLDSLRARVAVLDPLGRVILLNQAWEQPADPSGLGLALQAHVGSDYLELFRQAAAHGGVGAQEALSGLEQVIRRERDEWIMEYPTVLGSRETLVPDACDSPENVFGRGRGDPRGHYRASTDREGPASGPENGNHRPAGRRCGP